MSIVVSFFWFVAIFWTRLIIHGALTEYRRRSDERGRQSLDRRGPWLATWQGSDEVIDAQSSAL